MLPPDRRPPVDPPGRGRHRTCMLFQALLPIVLAAPAAETIGAAIAAERAAPAPAMEAVKGEWESGRWGERESRVFSIFQLSNLPTPLTPHSSPL